MSTIYLVSKLDYYGIARPVAVAHSLAEADALVDKLSAEVPKGELAFYCREAVEGGVVHPKPFTVKSLAAAMADFE